MFCAILKDRTCPGEAVFLGMMKSLILSHDCETLPQGTGRVRTETPALGEMGHQVKDAEPVREPVRGWRVGIGDRASLVFPSMTDFMTTHHA